MKKLILFLMTLVTLLATSLTIYASQDYTQIYFSQDTTAALAALPVTEGNQVDSDKEWGQVTNWDFNNTTNKFYFEMRYREQYYQVYDVEIEGDVDFIAKAKRIMYFTEKESNDRILYFSFGSKENSVLLQANSMQQASNWEGEALFNLSNGQVKVIDKIDIYNYIPGIDADGNIYSYFYMPDVIISNLISVTANLSYQYQKTGFLGLGGLGPIEMRTVSMVKGESTSVNPTWVSKVYNTSKITSIAAIAANAYFLSTTASIPVYGWAIAGVSIAVMVASRLADVNEVFAYDVNQIERVTTLDEGTRNSINDYIFSKSGGTQGVDLENNKMYKLHLAQLDASKKPFVRTEESVVTQVVYETNGQVNLVQKDYINDVGWVGPGTNPDTTINNTQTFWEQFGLLIVVIGLGLIAIKFDVFRNNRIAIIYVVLSVAVLLLTGVLRL